MPKTVISALYLLTTLQRFHVITEEKLQKIDPKLAFCQIERVSGVWHFIKRVSTTLSGSKSDVFFYTLQ